MTHKKILRPDRLRQVPSQFSWLDQRLVRDNFITHAGRDAWALYLVMATVADAQGLSYYSDATLGRLLRMEPGELARARQELVQAGLIAYEKPLCQVLALPAPRAATPQEEGPRAGRAQSAGEILRRVCQEVARD